MSVLSELEIAAQTTDAEAVQRAFDARNTLMVSLYAVTFAVADFGFLLYGITASRARTNTWLVALIETLLSVATVLVTKRLMRSRHRPPDRVAAAISRNLSDWLCGYLLVQFAGFAYVTGLRGTIGWGTFFPFMLIALRFSFARRLFLQAALLATTIGFLFFFNGNTRSLGTVLATNAISIPIGAFNSRRVRRDTIAEWIERRESAREQLRMRDELRYARELQLSMLPEAPPSVDWADIAGVSIPATEVGGDYFDYIAVDGCLAVVCGDVAGHGLSSGITLSALRGGLTLLRNELADPAHVLERLHEVVTESSRRRTLVTLTAALFDPNRRRAIIANAGHPPVLIRRASGTVEAVELFGPPLGVRRSESVPRREVAFAAGDVFVLHSDGIYEATNASGEQYGLERLTEAVAKSDGSAAEIRDAVLRSVEQFRSNAPQHDDLTLVVVRIIAPVRTSDRS